MVRTEKTEHCLTPLLNNREYIQLIYKNLWFFEDFGKHFCKISHFSRNKSYERFVSLTMTPSSVSGNEHYPSLKLGRQPPKWLLILLTSDSHTSSWPSPTPLRVSLVTWPRWTEFGISDKISHPRLGYRKTGIHVGLLLPTPSPLIIGSHLNSTQITNPQNCEIISVYF